MSAHGGDRVAEALAAHGVRFVFTLCGGHTAPILVAAKARGLRVVDVRHEATAVFAADAVARLTGVPGVAVVTAGPGLTNVLTALKNAELAQSPLVLIGGAAPTVLKGRGALQDIDQRALIAPHVKSIAQVRRVRDLAPALARAFATAQHGVPGPVFVECPIDLLYPEATIRTWYAASDAKRGSLGERLVGWYLRRHVARLFAGSTTTAPVVPAAVPTPEPPDAAVVRAAACLARARRPLLVVGSQALAVPGTAAAIAASVTTLGIPVYLSGMARGLLGPEHPLQLRHRRRDALRAADCVILAGVPCDFRLDYGRHVRRDATLIAANRSVRDARLNRRPRVLAHGDAGVFLQKLAARGPVPEPADWLASLRERDAARDAEIDAAARAPATYVGPLALCRAIERTAGPDAMFVADGGDFVGTASYVLRPRTPLSWLDPGVFGTLGVGAGFALGAKLCRPGADVWLVLGDGAAGYGLVEFDTFVRHGLAVIAVVGNDAGWTQIAREQTKLLGDDVGTVLARTDYDAVAAGFGAAGVRVTRADAVDAALRQARDTAATGRPVLVNVWLDRSAFREGSISM